MVDEMDVDKQREEEIKQEKADEILLKTKKKKDEVDWTPEVETRLATAASLVDSGKLQDAIDTLFALEKQTRLSGDAPNTEKLCIAIISHCHNKKEWALLQEQVLIISKRRSQIKKVISAVVKEAMKYLDDTPDKQTKLDLLAALRTVTEGKIFVELERARLTRMLASIHEADGKIEEAADVLQEVQVETFGSMEKREKADFILEQIRLCLDRKDYVRANIIHKKINLKTLGSEEFDDLVIRYHELMSRLFIHEDKYFELAQGYQAILDRKTTSDDKAKSAEALKHVIVYLTLSPHNNEQSDFLHRTAARKQLFDMSTFSNFVKAFTTDELIFWPEMQSTYKGEFSQLTIFSGDKADKRWEDLNKRVVEHNVRVVAKYYTQIQTVRLGELLNLGADKTEEVVSDMVSGKSLYARIDRPGGVIVFAPKKEPEEILNDWSTSLSTLCSLVEKTCHMIHKETMVHSLAR